MLPPQQIQEEFRERRSRQWTAAIPGVAAFAIALWATRHPEGMFGLPSGTVAIGAFVVVAVYVIFSLRNWRCPSCERYLGKGMNPSFCRKCGTKLQS